jgi:hypothetical protein
MNFKLLIITVLLSLALADDPEYLTYIHKIADIKDEFRFYKDGNTTHELSEVFEGYNLEYSVYNADWNETDTVVV